MLRPASAFVSGVSALAFLTGCSGPAEPVTLPFRDDFSGACEWPAEEDEAPAECDDGGYLIHVTQEGGPQASLLDFEPASETLRVEAVAELLGAADDMSPEDAFGLGCWSSGGDGYAFYVWASGEVAIFAEDADRQEGTLLVTRDRPRGPFRLPAGVSAECVGGTEETTLVLSLGDEVVAVAKSARGRESFAAFGLGAYTDRAEATLRFDDVRVRPLGAGEAADRRRTPALD